MGERKALRKQGNMKPGWIVGPEATAATIKGAPNIQTPSQAEHGLEGVFIFGPANLVLVRVYHGLIKPEAPPKEKEK